MLTNEYSIAKISVDTAEIFWKFLKICDEILHVMRARMHSKKNAVFFMLLRAPLEGPQRRVVGEKIFWTCSNILAAKDRRLPKNTVRQGLGVDGQLQKLN